MAERLNITVDDGIGDLLAELAGSRNKMGEMVSTLVRAAQESGRIPAVHDVDTLRLMVVGFTAELKALRIELEQWRELVGDASHLGNWPTLTEGIQHMLRKEGLIHNMHERLTAIDGNWDDDWEVDESEWMPHAQRAGSKQGLLLVERIRRIEEKLKLQA